jgi:RimJ/RimL family protein N-acetyltransferase
MDLDTFFPPDRHVPSDAGFVLRSWMPGDGAALREAAVSSYEHLKATMPWADAEQTVHQAEHLVRAMRARWLLREDFAIALWNADETRVLGGSGLHLREGPLHTGQAEIGMWIRASEAGAGLGTRVLKAVVDWAFTAWPFERLSWKCNATNVASQRVAQKAGFTFEGVIRGEYDAVNPAVRREGWAYSLLETDWDAQRTLPLKGPS